MKYDFNKTRIYNSFAYRYNKFLNQSEKFNSVLKNLSLTKKLNNVVFTIPIINSLGEMNLQIGEDWFFKLIKSLKLPADGDFLDIGVNVGQSLLTFRSCYNSTYWGFEPNPSCVYYVENLIRVNQIKNVHIVPVGLSSTNSVAKFYSRHDGDSAASLLTENRPGFFQSQDAKYVPVFSYGSLQLDISKISLIKIDVEGAELEVVIGMLETIHQHQPVITCEILDYTAPESKDLEQNRATRLFNLLKEINYHGYRILDKGREQLEFERLDYLELRQWTPRSFDLNDYLFLPPHITSLPI